MFYIESFMPPRATYVNTFILQATNDPSWSSVTDILIVGSEVREGWNAYDVDDFLNTDEWAFFRLISTTIGLCSDLSDI